MFGTQFVFKFLFRKRFWKSKKRKEKVRKHTCARPKPAPGLLPSPSRGPVSHPGPNRRAKAQAAHTSPLLIPLWRIWPTRQRPSSSLFSVTARVHLSARCSPPSSRRERAGLGRIEPSPISRDSLLIAPNRALFRLLASPAHPFSIYASRKPSSLVTTPSLDLAESLSRHHAWPTPFRAF